MNEYFSFLILLICLWGCNETLSNDTAMQHEKFDAYFATPTQIPETTTNNDATTNISEKTDDGDTIDTPVSIHWNTSPKEQSGSELSELIFVLENETSDSYEVTPSVNCKGFFNQTSKSAIPSVKLESFESVEIKVPVSNLPIQNSTGEARVVVKAGFENLRTGDVLMASSVPLLYKFENTEWNSLRLLQPNDLPETNVRASSVRTTRGRILSAQQKIESINSTHDAFILRNAEDNEPLAKVISYGVGVGEGDTFPIPVSLMNEISKEMEGGTSND